MLKFYKRVKRNYCIKNEPEKGSFLILQFLFEHYEQETHKNYIHFYVHYIYSIPKYSLYVHSLSITLSCLMSIILSATVCIN